METEGPVFKTNKAKEEASGEKVERQRWRPGLVPASRFAFEQESRCRVTIRRKKAPGTCEAARPTTYGREEKGEQSENRAPRGGGSSRGLARSGDPLSLERKGRSCSIPGLAAEWAGRGAWRKEPSLSCPEPGHRI